MKLKFRGISYSNNSQPMPTTKTDITGRFLGQKYQINRSVATGNNSKSRLTYRGITY